jgi:hypothetical protein
VQKLRCRLRAFTCTALLAAFGLALIPTLSHALNFAVGAKSAWTEICTPQGMQVVSVGEAVRGDEAPAAGQSPLEHCPYCAQGASSLGMPSAPTASMVLCRAGTEAPALWLRAPRTLFVWAAAQPRAPPQVLLIAR